MHCSEVLFSRHALTRMFDRGITRDEVLEVLAHGETIQAYPDDQPYPSELRLGCPGGQPIHAVVAFDAASNRCIVVTAYVPDPELWSEDFRSRRP